MKKYFMAMIAVMSAIAAFAFTKMPESKQTAYYWFPLNSDGTAQTVTTMPTKVVTDPISCPTGIVHFCAGGYNTVVDNGNGTYSAGGARQATDKKP